MGYKVKIDALFDMYSAIKSEAEAWNGQLQAINTNMRTLVDSTNMSGVAAENIKRYIETVHGSISALLAQLITVHQYNCLLYVNDYNTNIDTGLHAVIIAEKLKEYKGRIDGTKGTAIQINDEISYVLAGIKDIFQISYSDVSSVDAAHADASVFLTKLDEDILGFEDRHNNSDFLNTATLISTLEAAIKEQLETGRSYRTNFQQKDFASMESFRPLFEASLEIEKEINEKRDSIETAIGNLQERISAIEQEEREWVRWIATGVAVIGAVALIVVTAGTASPVACVVVGACTGIATSATEHFTENYIETGSLTEGMDWSEFSKDCLIGGVSGAITGYMGSASMGSVIKQPITKACNSLAESVVTESAKGLIDTAWDVGEAVVMGKPGTEVLSILDEKVDQMSKEVLTGAVTSFATGYIGGKHAVDSSTKGFLKTFGEKSVENLVQATVKNGTESAWDFGNALLDPNSSKDVTTILKEEGKEFAENWVGDVAKGEVEALVSGTNKSIRKKIGYDDEKPGIINNVVADTVADTAGTFVGGISKQWVEEVDGNRKNMSVQEVWEEDLQGGQAILESAGKSAGKHISDYKFKDEELHNSLKKSDSINKDGTIDVVVFDKYAVKKEDYDAAREVARHGAYKNQTAQDILGLPKNTAISEKNVRVETVSVKNLKESEYKGRKTTNVTKLDFVKNPIYEEKKK